MPLFIRRDLELVNLFVGTKNVRYHICYENIEADNIAKYSEVKRQTDHGETELSNMLVKNVLNEIKKEHSLKVSRTAGKSKGKCLKI